MEVDSPSRTSDSAMVTAAATPSTTGTPVRSADLLVQPGHAAAAEDDHLGLVLGDGPLGLPTMASTARSGSSSSSRTAMPLARTEAHRRVQPGQFQPVLDQRDRPVQGGDHRVFVAQEHGGTGGRLGDVHDRDVQQLLQPLAAVFAVAGLDDGVERFRVGRAPRP